MTVKTSDDAENKEAMVPANPKAKVAALLPAIILVPSNYVIPTSKESLSYSKAKNNLIIIANLTIITYHEHATN